MKQQLMIMLELQDEMNSKVHPDWREQGFEWYRAIWIECAELMDHHGWKWWKKQSPDRDQVILELIDIWHFGLSQLMLSGKSLDILAEEVAQQLSQPLECGDFLEDVEAFAVTVLQTREFDVSSFARLLKSMNLSFEGLYRSYVGKNVLNIFRQDNGYKTGSYSKIWDSREDNEHLVEIVNILNVESPSFKGDIYRELQERYPGELPITI